ncbi:MAG: hypothetical protein ORN49_09410 [Rhodobacteraceae bacterium]|nr:hypothetical protein [Paracoccaceae bacterium]
MRRLPAFITTAFLVALRAHAADPPDPARIAEAQAKLDRYHDILSDISCDAPTIPAHQLMCEDNGL